MKKIMVIITVIMLSVGSFPLSAFASEDTENLNLTEELLIEEPELELADISVKTGLLNNTINLLSGDLIEETENPPVSESSRNLKVSEFMLRDSGCAENCVRIELYNESESDFFLSGWKIKYINTTGSVTSDLVDNISEIGAYEYVTFSRNSMTGFANGHIQIVDENGDEVDTVGYGSGKTYAKGGAPTVSPPDGKSLQRCELPSKLLVNTGKNSEDFKEYLESTWDGGVACTEDDDSPNSLVMCEFISLNEISFSDPEKFIEIINTTINTIDLTDCALRRGNNYIYLDGDLKPGEIKSFSVTDPNLTQTNNSVNIYVYDIVQKKNVMTVGYKAKSGASYAWLNVNGIEDWYTTFAMTPGQENIYQQFQTCEAGKHINVATGNCVKDPDPPAECAEGQYRNPETGRCKKIDSDKTLAECAEGQYRNPLTNRCKKIASADELSPCAEGWERNPETNRCRKIPIGSEAAYAISPTADSDDSGTWMGIALGGVALIAGLIVWQFRPEISRFFGRVFSKVRK